MIKYLKAKNHKGIKEVVLSELGQFNVICGKNNSGKSSILEAIIEEKKYSIGKKIDEFDWFMKLFSTMADGYSTPNPFYTKLVFETFLNKIIQEKTIVFHDDKSYVLETYTKHWRDDRQIGNYSPINIDSLLDNFFKNCTQNFKPILIPPKRYIDNKIKIELNEVIEPDGTGLTNRLFYLKNQDIDSLEFKTYQKIHKAFKQITNYNFNIVPDKENNINLVFQKVNGPWTDADFCGMGLVDVFVIINFAIDFDYNFLLIEEPESHLHPDMQKKLMQFLKSVKSRQFLVSTHSSVFLNPYIVDRIFYTEIDDEVKITDETTRSTILYNLGYSVTDNIVSDVVVLVEGPTDIPIITNICDWLGFGNKFNIKYWPLGGDIMASLDLSIFSERKNVIALIDNDPGSSPIRTRFEKNCKEHGISCHRLKRYSIENYFTLDAIKIVLPDKVPKELLEIDHNISVDKQMGFIKKEKKTDSIKPKSLEIIKNMQLSDIKESDLYTFCLKIKRICETSQSNN